MRLTSNFIIDVYLHINFVILLTKPIPIQHLLKTLYQE